MTAVAEGQERTGRARRGTALGLALLATVSFLLGGCGTSSTASGSSAGTVPPDFDPPVDLTGKKEVTIKVVDNAYEPRSFAVSPNTKIVFVNDGRNEHNVYPAQDGAFPPIKSEQLQPGQSASFTLANTGEVTFYCSIHGTPQRGQRGAVVVRK